MKISNFYKEMYIYADALLAVSVRDNIIQLLSTGIIHKSFSIQDLKGFSIKNEHKYVNR